ncbi:hypothetical protein [Dyadobacter sp. LHD-138]|uniref:hypothetical protein n=1 Tax=Dyadobacter sp. LHD-138 TaxID=3071413 RepID=UPI0027E148E5|nr:hypothetical protein [Dyadobacter sp. LHD-138]MDQ6479989.1 hypothetical protein [Dyadobacter sp. LHD-138]
MNNDRVVSQFGWFTAHKYSPTTNSFVSLETNKKLKQKIAVIQIPAKERLKILQTLSKFGINHNTIFPGIEGLCSHLNWSYGL